MDLTEEEEHLIKEEEQLLEDTLQSLCQQLPLVQESKISANIAARELTKQVVNEWNHEERQPLVSDETVAHRILDIRKNSDKALYALIQEPYFGRVCTKEEDGSEVSFLIGKKSNIDAGIVDWRNGPIAGLYFNYKQEEEFYEVINQRERSGHIQLRRSYRVECGQLVQIDTPEGIFRRSEAGWAKLDVGDEAAAHRSRAFGSTEKSLPNILSLITKDQFELITSDADRPVIIQGSAGSGKTTVALHRLAWLLHEGNSIAKAKNTRVVVMNKSLQIYVCATLPSMGIEGVQTSTFNSWALSIIGKVVRGRPFFKYLNVPSFVEEIKYSEEILKSLESWVDKQYLSLNKEIEYQELEIQLSDKQINQLKELIEKKKEELAQAEEKLGERENHLKHKKEELDAILAETQKEEDLLLKKSAEFEKKVEERLVAAYKRIRSSVRNGLAVVPIERGASAGSFFTIPPQVQLEIASRKKIITDEHSGRILVDAELAQEEQEKIQALFSS